MTAQHGSGDQGRLYPYGVHHVAINVSDVKSALQFFNEVLGMELVMMYWMHGADNTVHAFQRINDYSLLGFVDGPSMPEEIEIGKTHPGSPEGLSAGGTLHSLCFEVESEEDLIALRNRIRSKGIHCFGPSKQGGDASIVFAGPDGMVLRVAVKPDGSKPLPMNLEAAAAAGLSPEDVYELARPGIFERPESPIKNPKYGDDSGYRLAVPEKQGRLMAAIPDQWLYDAMSFSTPPTESKPAIQLKRWWALAKIAAFAVLGPLTGRT